MDKKQAWEVIAQSTSEYYKLKGEQLQQAINTLKPEEEPKEE